MSEQFYRAFEERYYAPRQIIRRLRQQYLPFIEPLSQLYPGSATIDLGCGRGEWLELMLESGFSAFGVDLDEGMLQGCKDLKLPAQQGDAIAYLATLPDESQAVVSAFHVVEHITFEQLTQVVTNALRVLKPGGLLILETPNPENIVVGTANFYIDPTHQKPIPHQLLSFLPEHHGFSRTKVLRLQESDTLLQQNNLGLHDVFTGSSPDYAVIAQKTARIGILEQFDAEFSKEHGLSLADLSSHYDAGIQAPINRLTERLKNIELEYGKRLQTQLQEQSHQTNLAQRALRADVHALETKLETHIHQQFHKLGLEAQGLHNQMLALRQAHEHTAEVQQVGLAEKLRHAEQRAQEAEIKLTETSAALRAMRSSTFWRLSAPMRWLTIQLKLVLTQGPFARAKALARKISGTHPAPPFGANHTRDIHPVAGATTSQNEPAKPQVQPQAADAWAPPQSPTVHGPASADHQAPILTPRAVQTESKSPLNHVPAAPTTPAKYPEPKVSKQVDDVYKKLKGSTNQMKEPS